MPVDASFVPKLAKKVRLRFDRHSGKHMLIYPERGLELNDSAAEIAKRCDGARTVMDIANDIVKEQGLHPRQIEEVLGDILAFVEDLRKKGLLETSE